MAITVANGQKIVGQEKCENFSWFMHRIKLNVDLRLLKLGSYEIVLGHDFMNSYFHSVGL